MAPAAALNLAAVVSLFSVLAGAPFSQRCRAILAYMVVPFLMLFALQRAVTGVNLPEELIFYSQYHSEWRNIIIHIIFVPTLIWTVMVMFAYVPLFGKNLNFSHLYAATYTIFHISCDPTLGSLASLLWWAMAFTATQWVASKQGDKTSAKGTASWARGTCAKYAGIVHLLSWYMQLHPGHKVFEGRKPALLDGLYQSLSVAPLFVFYEAAFAMGYRPELSAQVHKAVTALHAAL